MSDAFKNGAPPTEALPHAPGAAPTIEQAVTQLDPLLTAIIGTMIRGILVSAPGLPAHLLMSMIALKAGSTLASAVQADLTTLLTIRKNLKDAFDKGVKSAPMSQPAGQMPPDQAELAKAMLRNGH